MPELPEVHRAAHFLRLYLVSAASHTFSKVSYYSPPNNTNAATQTNDPKIFDTAKTGTDAASFSKALQGKKIKDVGRLGKYFWLEMESAPHPLFHFGMTGWIKYKGGKGKGVDYWQGKVEGRGSGAASKKAKKEDDDDEVDGERPQEVPEEEWPPKFAKVLFEAKSENGETTEFAFVDGRRFAKILLVEPESGKSVRESEPLVQNGPDPILEGDKITKEWLSSALAKKKVPIKAFLLDQHNMSGVGNWVADEVLFHARIHPEAVSSNLDDEQIKRLVEKVKEVCKIAALDALGDSNSFPDDWLMRHRWRLDKTGDSGQLPSGEKIIRITVGGRTSAVVPSRQGKSANSKVRAQEDKAEAEGEVDEAKTSKGKGGKKRKAQVKDEEDEGSEDEKMDDAEESEEEDVTAKRGAKRSAGRGQKGPSKQKAESTAKKQKTVKSVSDTKGSAGTRRSSRGGNKR